MMLPGIGAGDEMLAPIPDPAHGMSQRPGEPRDADLLRLQNAFVAEAAADIGRDDAQLPLLDAETVGKPVADEMRHLCRSDDDKLIMPVVPVGKHALTFER